jgi:hypothetical protein
MSRTARSVPERCAGLVWHSGRFASAEPAEPYESAEPAESDESDKPCEPDESDDSCEPGQ